LDLDPLIRGADPRIRIRTKMSRIPNTGMLYLKSVGKNFRLHNLEVEIIQPAADPVLLVGQRVVVRRV
jgi:hypothetical protein